MIVVTVLVTIFEDRFGTRVDVSRRVELSTHLAHSLSSLRNSMLQNASMIAFQPEDANVSCSIPTQTAP